MSLHFTLEELQNLDSALANGPVSTALLGTACGWQDAARWGKLKDLEKLGFVQKLDEPPFADLASVRWGAPDSGALKSTISSELIILQQNVNLPKRFIRRGNWCICGRSIIGTGPEFEAGISAYNARWNGHGWQPTDKAFWRLKIANVQLPSPWYLLDGQIVGTGSDGEPLLASPVALKKLTWVQEKESFATTSTTLDIHQRTKHPGC